MDQDRHWNRIGANYDSEIFDVFQSDRLGRLKRMFKRYGNRNHVALDFGCGTGKALPHLSPIFKKVVAVDISVELLTQAKARGYNNVEFVQADLTESFKSPSVDFAFCCNVIMLPDLQKNEAMFRNMFQALRKGRAAVIVLPSLDSFFYSASRLIEWYRKEGVHADEIIASEFDGFKSTKRDLIQGLVQIDGVVTKHYSLPELELILPQFGFSIQGIERLEYEWDSEFSSPPKWMKDPYPWDWLVELRT